MPGLLHQIAKLTLSSQICKFNPILISEKNIGGFLFLPVGNPTLIY